MSERGGRVAAISMSLLMTATAADVDPKGYFKDVLLRISEPGMTANGMAPRAWKKRFEAEVSTCGNEILRKIVGAA